MVQPYLFELAGLAMQVQEIDEAITLSQPQEKIFERVLGVEGHLRSLKAETLKVCIIKDVFFGEASKLIQAKDWWVEYASELEASQLIQFWHYYLTTRIHLHMAMSEDEHDQYSYSRIACTEASESMARRYWYLRRLLPRGFFVCRIIGLSHPTPQLLDFTLAYNFNS